MVQTQVPNFTRTVPTESGHYWRQISISGKLEVVKLTIRENDYVVRAQLSTTYHKNTEPNWYFWGPKIEEPPVILETEEEPPHQVQLVPCGDDRADRYIVQDYLTKELVGYSDGQNLTYGCNGKSDPVKPPRRLDVIEVIRD